MAGMMPRVALSAPKATGPRGVMESVSGEMKDVRRSNLQLRRCTLGNSPLHVGATWSQLQNQQWIAKPMAFLEQHVARIVHQCSCPNQVAFKFI